MRFPGCGVAGISVPGKRPGVTVWDFRPDLESYDSLLLLIFGLEHSEGRFQFPGPGNEMENALSLHYQASKAVK